MTYVPLQKQSQASLDDSDAPMLDASGLRYWTRVPGAPYQSEKWHWVSSLLLVSSALARNRWALVGHPASFLPLPCQARVLPWKLRCIAPRVLCWRLVHDGAPPLWT